MGTRRANIVTTHDIKFNHSNGDEAFEVDNYTSLKFSSFFEYHTHSLFRFAILISVIPHIAIHCLILIGITSIVNLIHLNGGFIVTGWCKKGEVDD